MRHPKSRLPDASIHPPDEYDPQFVVCDNDLSHPPDQQISGFPQQIGKQTADL